MPREEIQERLKDLPGWRCEYVEGVPHLIREFLFPNFASALSFTNHIGIIAEEQEHHPAILTEYGRVTVSWWSHRIGALHRNDFIMAARTDELYFCL